MVWYVNTFINLFHILGMLINGSLLTDILQLFATYKWSDCLVTRAFGRFLLIVKMSLNDIGNFLVLRSNTKVLPGIPLSERALV